MNAPTKERRLARRIPRLLAALTIAGAVAAAALLASLWLEHRREVSLPVPTGPFGVGRALFDWVDENAVDTLAPSPGTKRELLVWIWYPTATGQSVAVEDYLPARVRAEVERSRGRLISGFLTRDLSRVHPHSLRGVDVSTLQPPYPVVILRAGASAEVWNYQALAEDLASHGYVVVGLDAPYRSHVVVFPDGRVMRRLPQNNPELCLERTGEERARCADRLLRAWSADSSFVLDRLAELSASDPSGKYKGRFDTSRVGVLGHSFGGAAAMQFCHDDVRCTAGIDIDGAPAGRVVEASLHKPFMFLLSDHDRETDPEATQIRAEIQSIYDRLPAQGRRRITIRGANHFMFSDDGALLKSGLVRGVLHLLGQLRIDGPRQLAITAYCVRSFFDAHLKGMPPRVDSPLYPEIRVEDSGLPGPAGWLLSRQLALLLGIPAVGSGRACRASIARGLATAAALAARLDSAYPHAQASLVFGRGR
jgi:dienelactone hydrolase